MKTLTVASARAARLRRRLSTHCRPPCAEESREMVALLTFSSCVPQQLRGSAPPRTCAPPGVQVRLPLSRKSIRAATPQRRAESAKGGSQPTWQHDISTAFKHGGVKMRHGVNWNGFPVRAGRQVEEEEPGLSRIKDLLKKIHFNFIFIY